MSEKLHPQRHILIRASQRGYRSPLRRLRWRLHRLLHPRAHRVARLAEQRHAMEDPGLEARFARLAAGHPSRGRLV